MQKLIGQAIDLFRNSTFAETRVNSLLLESSRTSKYAAVLRSESPTTSLAETSFERGLLLKSVIV